MEAELVGFGRRTIIFRNPNKAYRTIQRIVASFSEVSVAGEGKNMGPCGEVSVLQVGTCDGMCFTFDLQSCPELVTDGGLKFLLETPTVIKIMHDCRGLSAALFCRFRIALTNIFDTQCAHAIIQSQFNSTSPYDIPAVDLWYICARYSCGENGAANYLAKHRSSCEPSWTDRPLLNYAVCLAASRVLCLIPEIYDNMRAMICADTWPIFQKMTHLNIIFHVYPEQYETETRQRMQKRYHNLLVVKHVEDFINSAQGREITDTIGKLLGEIKDSSDSFTTEKSSAYLSTNDIAKNSECELPAPKKKRANCKNKKSAKTSGTCEPNPQVDKQCHQENNCCKENKGCQAGSQVTCEASSSHSPTTASSEQMENEKCISDSQCYGGSFEASKEQECKKIKNEIVNEKKSTVAHTKVGSSDCGKKTLTFGKGYTVPPEKAKSLVQKGSGGKILKRKTSKTGDEPACKKRKRKTPPLCPDENPDEKYVKAMKDWMTYLGLCHSMDKAMSRSDCKKPPDNTTDKGCSCNYCSSPVYEEDTEYADCSCPLEVESSCSGPTGDSSTAKLKKTVQCKRCDGGCKKQAKKKKCKPKQPASPALEVDGDADNDDEKDESCETEEEVDSDEAADEEVEMASCGYEFDDYDGSNPLPCGICNCQATSCSRKSSGSPKKCLKKLEPKDKNCFKNEAEKTGHKCTCVDCWLTGAKKNERDNSDPKSNTCEHGCPCARTSDECSACNANKNCCDKHSVAETSMQTSSTWPRCGNKCCKHAKPIKCQICGIYHNTGNKDHTCNGNHKKT